MTLESRWFIFCVGGPGRLLRNFILQSFLFSESLTFSQHLHLIIWTPPIPFKKTRYTLTYISPHPFQNFPLIAAKNSHKFPSPSQTFQETETHHIPLHLDFCRIPQHLLRCHPRRRRHRRVDAPRRSDGSDSTSQETETPRPCCRSGTWKNAGASGCFQK